MLKAAVSVKFEDEGQKVEVLCQWLKDGVYVKD